MPGIPGSDRHARNWRVEMSVQLRVAVCVAGIVFLIACGEDDGGSEAVVESPAAAIEAPPEGSLSATTVRPGRSE